jgi:uncharacterized protein YbaA (DUF1428 family)
MATYVDGFVLVVPKKKLDAYKKMAREASRVWKKYGALEYKECVAEDIKGMKGMGVPFGKLVKAKPGETVIFSFVVYKSRKHRDQVNAKVMSDPSMKKYENMPMPFDMNRFSFGGFETIVEF